jgi:Cell wall-active antibiotics response 4TMS YvqF
VAWGVSVLSGASTMTRRYWGVLLIGFGVLGVLLNLGVLRLHTRDDSWLLAVLLIALGFLALIKTIEGSTTPSPKFGFPQQTETTSDNMLNEHTVAGGIRRRVETPNFLGGKIECVFGSVELDLRQAQIASTQEPVTVDVNCVFGSTKMRVPDTWLVTVLASGVMGTVEDKTLPPRTANGFTPPKLVVTGQAVFSSVEVEN